MNVLTEWIKRDLKPAIYDNLDTVFPEFGFKMGNGWMAKRYLNGDEHKRPDKLICKNVKGLFEQGGPNIGFIDYLVEYKNMTKIEAIKHLASKVNLSIPEDKNWSITAAYTSKRKQSTATQRKIIDQSKVDATISSHTDIRKSNRLYKYLLNFFPPKKVDEAFELYKIGTIKSSFYVGKKGNKSNLGPYDGVTVFWIIDTDQKAYSGEYIAYDEITGSSIKSNGDRCGRPIHNFYRNTDKEWYKDFTSGCVDYRPFPFGMHLLKDKPLKKPIAIVESAKTAIIGHLLLPEFTWMATMGKSNFSLEKLSSLKNHRLVAFPDKGKAFVNWRLIVREIRQEGYMITISSAIEDNEALKDGDDLADVLNIEAQLTT